MRNVSADVAASSGARNGNLVPNAPRLNAAVTLQYRGRLPGLDSADAPNLFAAAQYQFCLLYTSLAKNDAASLRRAFNCTDDDVRDACALIRSLDPKPGRRYDAQAPAYVVPDVFVDKWRSRWRVVPNRGAMPLSLIHI